MATKLLDLPQVKGSDLVKTTLDQYNSLLASLREELHVGRVIATFDDRDPGDYLGGSWTSLGARVLYGVERTEEIGEEGGSTEHHHRETVGWDGHNGIYYYGANTGPYFGSEHIPRANSYRMLPSWTETDTNARIGFTSSEASMPPYVRCRLWRRVS